MKCSKRRRRLARGREKIFPPVMMRRWRVRHRLARPPPLRSADARRAPGVRGVACAMPSLAASVEKAVGVDDDDPGELLAVYECIYARETASAKPSEAENVDAEARAIVSGLFGGEDKENVAEDAETTRGSPPRPRRRTPRASPPSLFPPRPRARTPSSILRTSVGSRCTRTRCTSRRTCSGSTSPR